MDTKIKGKAGFNNKVATLKEKNPTELTIGERLLLLRLENGITNQEEFAKELNLSKSAINKYENDDAKPDYDTLSLIAEKFQVSFDYLFGYSDSKSRVNHDVKSVTGLSDEAIKGLIDINNTQGEVQSMEFLNRLLSDPLQFGLLCIQVKHYLRKKFQPVTEVHLTSEELNQCGIFPNPFIQEENIEVTPEGLLNIKINEMQRDYDIMFKIYLQLLQEEFMKIVDSLPNYEYKVESIWDSLE